MRTKRLVTGLSVLVLAGAALVSAQQKAATPKATAAANTITVYKTPT